LLRTHTDLLVPYLKANLLAAELSWRGDGGAARAEAARLRPVFARAYDRALSDVDVLVMPTCPTVAPDLGTPASALGSLAGGERSVARNTRPFNFTGHPALAVPCGTAHGLPISMQLVGRFLDDALLVRVARAYELAVSG
jgi:amidase